jgi:hypothetical protein
MPLRPAHSKEEPENRAPHNYRHRGPHTPQAQKRIINSQTGDHTQNAQCSSPAVDGYVEKPGQRQEVETGNESKRHGYPKPKAIAFSCSCTDRPRREIANLQGLTSVLGLMGELDCTGNYINTILLAPNSLP